MSKVPHTKSDVAWMLEEKAKGDVDIDAEGTHVKGNIDENFSVRQKNFPKFIF